MNVATLCVSARQRSFFELSRRRLLVAVSYPLASKGRLGTVPVVEPQTGGTVSHVRELKDICAAYFHAGVVRDAMMKSALRDRKGDTMKTIAKFGTAIALIGVFAMVAATPSEARYGRRAAAAVGFGAGALAGAAIVGARGYYYGPGYAYGLGYGPNYYGYWWPGSYAYTPGYAYAPGYASAAPVYGYGPGFPQTALGCWHVTDDWKGYGYYGECGAAQAESAAREARTRHHVQ